MTDCITSALSQPCLNFILAPESTDFKIAYMCDKIANMVHAHFPAFSFDGKPKVACYETSRFTPKASVSSIISSRMQVSVVK